MFENQILNEFFIETFTDLTFINILLPYSGWAFCTSFLGGSGKNPLLQLQIEKS